ncbi:hypothetical protein SBOR_7673 [Sclerotinia borealis F-4128]|uniref:Uncharacterized protein n=1 Tax=Sclerotinia borealis (strain F-4128) TaxID=1432307 RepID=W9C818_SCLBF|nr:hypothetical protein SBOR_7673 [Sclerotinia borealis F-4128]
MLSNLAYLLTSKSIALYVLYTLHVMLGTSLVFTALYTYSVHSSKAIAKAAALEASLLSDGTVMVGVSGMGFGSVVNGSAVEFEEEMESYGMDEVGEMGEMDMAIGGLNAIDEMRKVKSTSMMKLSTRRAGWENASTGFNRGNLKRNDGQVKFREICYGGDVRKDMGMYVPVIGGKELEWLLRFLEKLLGLEC